MEAASLLYRAFQHGNADKTVTAPTEPIKNDNTSQTTPATDKDIQQPKPDDDESKEEIKPYKIETLAKLVNAHNQIYDYNFVAQTADTLYYIDNNELYKIDTLSNKNESCAKSGDSVYYNSETYIIDKFIKVFYDNSTDRVLVSCQIKNQRS